MKPWLSAIVRGSAAAALVALLWTAPIPLLLRVAHRMPPWADPKLILFAAHALAFVLMFLIAGARSSSVSSEPITTAGLRAGAWLVLGTLMLSLLVYVSIVVSGKSESDDSSLPRMIEKWVEGLPNTGLGGRFVLFCVLGPIFEEFLFRGFILGFVLQRTATWFALLVSTFLFAAGHDLWPFAALIGLGYGLLYLRYENIWLCILVHGGHNLISAGLAPMVIAYLHDARLLVPVEASLLPLQATWLIAPLTCFAMFCWEVLGDLEEGPLRFMLRPRPSLA